MTHAGAYLGLVAAVALVGYAAQAMVREVHPPVLDLALLLTGVLEAFLSVHVLRGSRAAWSFAGALNGTLALVFLFAAPTIRDALGVGLALGFIPFALFAAITALVASGLE